MSKPQKSGSIEIAEDMDFQRRSWRVQRAWWIVMLLLILAALAGVFGGGPVSNAVAGGSGSPLTVEYQRFTRAMAPTTLTATVAPAGVSADSSIRLWVDRSWLESHVVDAVSPEPHRTQVDEDRVVYTFESVTASAGYRITLDLDTRRMGRVQGRIGLVDGPALSFGQFTYP